MAFAPRCLSLLSLLAAVCTRGASDSPGLAEAPLLARSQPAGATLFTRLPPEQTGIVTENRYADPRMWNERFQEFSVGALGTGIAIADFDGDGRPDLFVVSKTEKNRLFRNLGAFRFEDVTEKAGVGGPADAWCQGAAFADVNNDGRPDLYVTRFNAPNLLYVNQGDGTFREEAGPRGLALADASGTAAFCDYDRDGWLDVYVQTNLLDASRRPAGQRDHLYHNRGDGTFAEVTDQAGISGETQGHSATWWDFDADGWPDLYVANDFSPPDQLYRNNRDGTFTEVLAQVLPHTPYSSMGSDLGDVDNDGRIDLLVADMARSTAEADQRTMADTRARNRDPRDGVPPQYQRSALYLNTGTGRCQEAALLTGLAATDWTWSVRFEDLDNDGRLDLFATNGTIRELDNVDLLARMMVSESPLDRVAILRNSPIAAQRNLAFRNLGDLAFQDCSRAWGLDELGVSFGAAFGDFDGDGDLDLVYSNYQAGVSVLRNDAVDGHRAVLSLHGTRSNRFGVGATVEVETASGRQIRNLVLARGYLSTSEPVLHFGLGADARIRQLTVRWPSGQTQVFRDLPADRRFTVTEPNEAASAPAVTPGVAPPFAEVGSALGLGLASREGAVEETAQQKLLPFRHNRCGPALAVYRPSPEAPEQLGVGGTARDPARVLSRRGDGPFTAAPFLPPPDAAARVNDGPLLVFDANGDGFPDVLLTKGGASVPAGSPLYQPRLLLGQPDGSLAAAPSDAVPPGSLSVGAAVAADFDRDGQLDVFLGARLIPGRYPATPQSALWRNAGGRLEDVTEQLAPALREAGLVTAALWTDVDADGWPDLLVAVEWGPVRYFHNELGRKFVERTEPSGFARGGTGWWTSVAAGDFNEDGRMDYVVGNVGLNTEYAATPERPARLYYGSFGAPGAAQILEARYAQGRLVPVRTRRQLAAALPDLLKRFATNDAFARASLDEIAGAERLKAAQVFSATELRSGVFLSQPDGRFRFAPLPRMAQIAPLQGLAAGDFDGDGHADIYAVQNSFAPIPMTGRFDGGLSQLLRGDGRGGFEPVSPAASGLVVPGDAKALVTLDLDGNGWPDFVVSRNNDTLLAFRNDGVAGRHSLAVRLTGPKGNRDAVGARLEALRASGAARSLAEVHAGEGYFSQSSAVVFFGYTDSNPVREVRVRWPDGTETVQPVSASAATVVVRHP